MAGNGATVSKESHLRQAGFNDLPNDWVVLQVEDLLSDDRGISVGVMYPGKNDPHGVPLIKAGDLTGNIINPCPEFRVTAQKHEEYRRTEFSGGEILMTLVGDIGQCAIVRPEMAGWNSARAVAVIRFEDPTDASFVRQCFLSQQLQFLMQAWANTTVQPTLNLKEIRQLPLPWPPKRERDAIASILGSLDEKIELNRRMNETLESAARALFKSWFVDFDPVRAKVDGRTPAGMDEATARLFPSAFEDSELGKIPQGWSVGPVSEIIDITGGGTPKKSEPEYWDGNILWFSVKDAPSDSDVFVVGTDLKITERGLNESSTKLLPAGTTIISARGTVGKLALVAAPMAMNQSCYGISANSKSSQFFNFFLLRHVVEQLKQNAHGAVFDTITTTTFDTVDVVMADLSAVKQFDGLVEPLLYEIKSNLYQSQTLASLRDALLPKLLSGEIRVGEAAQKIENTVNQTPQAV